MAERQIDEAYVEMLKARDTRYRIIEQAIEIDREVSDSPTIRLIRAQASKEAAEALEALAFVTPTSTVEIIKLQAVVYRARFIDQTIGDLLKEAQRAQESLHDDHRAQRASAE